jgi:hypothetical protein
LWAKSQHKTKSYRPQKHTHTENTYFAEWFLFIEHFFEDTRQSLCVVECLKKGARQTSHHRTYGGFPVVYVLKNKLPCFFFDWEQVATFLI